MQCPNLYYYYGCECIQLNAQTARLIVKRLSHSITIKNIVALDLVAQHFHILTHQ